MITTNKIIGVIVMFVAIIIVALLLILKVDELLDQATDMQEKSEVFDRYSQPQVFVVKILNDHDVLLTNNQDTVHLYLENAYRVADEELIFVKIK